MAFCHFDSERLVQEAANSVFAVRNAVDLAALRRLWRGVADFCSASIASHKVTRRRGLVQGGTCMAAAA
jgi:hypothetical protein